MLTYNVEIPENKKEIFVEILNLIGGKYELKKIDFYISENQKKILDERLKEEKTNFIPARETIKVLREKYGL